MQMCFPLPSTGISLPTAIHGWQLQKSHSVSTSGCVCLILENISLFIHWFVQNREKKSSFCDFCVLAGYIESYVKCLMPSSSGQSSFLQDSVVRKMVCLLRRWNQNPTHDSLLLDLWRLVFCCLVTSILPLALFLQWIRCNFLLLYSLCIVQALLSKLAAPLLPSLDVMNSLKNKRKMRWLTIIPPEFCCYNRQKIYYSFFS